MTFFRRWLFILSALILGVGPLFAAGMTREQRAYAAAVASFRDGLWSHAETNFFQFLKKYPDSTNAPSAVLLLAQAEFRQGEFAHAGALLDQYNPEAGSLADQYAYWKAESLFASGNFSTSAKTFASVSHDFPQSSLRLAAQVEGASAYARILDWKQVENLLEDSNGVFLLTERLAPANELVSRGRLLLAQAKSARNDFPGALSILNLMPSQPLPPPLDWQRARLYCQVKMALGDNQGALVAATNLLQIAQSEDNDAHISESVAVQAGLLEKLNHLEEALAVYRLNLTNSAPPDSQLQAVLKVAELAVALKQYPVAEQSLDQFLTQFPDSPAAAVALFTVGELRLNLAQAQDTDQPAELEQARASFGHFLTTYTNSPLMGKAFLDRGWCGWLSSNYSGSLADFQDAARRLPPSEDLAVARFKEGDDFFALNDFSAARTNYQSVLNDFSAFPAVEKDLGGRALYQIIRASLALQDNATANNALNRLLKRRVLDEFAESSALLLGESTVDPRQARAVFQRLKARFPSSAWYPQIDLAVARTYEQEQDWPAAVTNYEAWVKTFPTNSLLPEAEFALALASFQAGNETNALNQFTRFVTQFPTNDLAPQAQWWVADYFFRRGGANSTNYLNAEYDYKDIFQNTNWQDSPLVYPAQLMAGRAAMSRQGYTDAIRYFTTAISDSNCPPDLADQARFAYGSVLMQMPSTDTNNPLANYAQATNVFNQITGGLRPRALGEIGDCAFQMGDYVSATNAYEQVFGAASPAGISLRSQAQVGFGLVLEKIAAQSAGPDQTNLLAQARDNYLDVFYGNNLRKDETVQDAFWTKKAGLLALPLIQALGTTDTGAFFDHLEQLFPQARDALEKKRAALTTSKS